MKSYVKELQMDITFGYDSDPFWQDSLSKKECDFLVKLNNDINTLRKATINSNSKLFASRNLKKFISYYYDFQKEWQIDAFRTQNNSTPFDLLKK